jgi:hypothetical protein
LVSRDTRTMPSAETDTTAAVLQAHCTIGWRHCGHMRPLSVE